MTMGASGPPARSTKRFRMASLLSPPPTITSVPCAGPNCGGPGGVGGGEGGAAGRGDWAPADAARKAAAPASTMGTARRRSLIGWPRSESGSGRQRVEDAPDLRKPRLHVVRLVAQADAQEAVHAELVARHH